MFVNILLNKKEYTCMFCDKNVKYRSQINYCGLPHYYLRYLHKFIYYINVCSVCSYKCHLRNRDNLNVVCKSIDEIMNELDTVHN